MERKNISGNSPYEPIVGFSRAVKVGPFVSVARLLGKVTPTPRRCRR
jgi:hypothetical protein